MHFFQILQSYTLALDEVNEAPYGDSIDLFINSDKIAMREKSRVRQTGFIAQEVELAATALGFEFYGVDAPDNEDDFYSLRYALFVAPS